MKIFAAQIRAARALLDWTRRDLATACDISEKTIQNYENVPDYEPRTPIVKGMVHALEAGGVEFISGGVKLADWNEPDHED